MRYRFARVPNDLDRAIQLCEQAEARQNGNPDLLGGIADGYAVRYDRDGHVADLNQAVAAATRYAAVAQPDHPNRDIVTAYAALARLLPKGDHLPELPVPAPQPSGGWLKRLWLARLAPPAVGGIDDANEEIKRERTRLKPRPVALFP